MDQPVPFGKYLLLDRINIGGMAEVFKAKTFGVDGFQRILAIKRILPNMADDAEFIDMFVDEARIAVQLSHANIVQIYELGKFESQYYIAMEYVSGRDLRQILTRLRQENRMLPLSAAIYIVSRICDGLDYAHKKTDASGRPLGVIHRDVSPQNILLGYEGEVKITDFGIAKAEDRASKTQAGVLKGKFGYMSPEQVRGLDIDKRSDVFSIGILLYEMLTGQRLFVGESDFSTLERVRNAEVPKPRDHNPDLSEELEAIIMKALAGEREDRYQDGSELADALQRFLITDGSIFSHKQLSLFMQKEFAEERTIEAKRMEEYNALPPPDSSDAVEGARQMREAKVAGNNDWGDSEKTMIFEYSKTSPNDQATQVGIAMMPEASPKAAGSSDVSVSSNDVSSSFPSKKSDAGLWFGIPKKTLALWGSVSTGLIAFVGVLVWLLVSTGTGSVTITGDPKDMELYLDGKLIGQHTPLSRGEVPATVHTLLAQAVGYSDKAFSFDVAEGRDTVINIRLESKRPELAAKATAEIVTEPAGASIRVGGLPRGVSPLTLTDLDPVVPTLVQISKDGFISKDVNVTFGPSERQTVLRVRLDPLGANQMPENGASAGSRPTTAEGILGQGGNERSTLKVIVDPEGAEVKVGGFSRGPAPVEVQGLDPNASYLVEVEQEGYGPYSKLVSFEGRNVFELRIALHRGDERPAPAPRPAKAPVSSSGGGGAAKAEAPKRPAGGSCSGTAGQLSVMASGATECKVTVGGQALGTAPFFKKASPTGKCAVSVVCGDGSTYKTSLTIDGQTPGKLIIKPEDWQ